MQESGTGGILSNVRAAPAAQLFIDIFCDSHNHRHGSHNRAGGHTGSFAYRARARCHHQSITIGSIYNCSDFDFLCFQSLHFFVAETSTNQSGSVLLSAEYIGRVDIAHFVIQRGFNHSPFVDTEFCVDCHGHCAGGARHHSAIVSFDFNASHATAPASLRQLRGLCHLYISASVR